LRGEALWEAVRQEMSRQNRHIMVDSARVAVFQEQNAKRFLVAVPASRTFARLNLMAEERRVFIEGLIRDLSGQSLSFVCEVRNHLPEPPPDPEIEPEPDPEPRPRTAAVKPAPAPAPTPEQQAPVAEAPLEPAPQVDEQQFLNDPLIRQALEKFEAEVEPS
jgi:hypothetical protein